MAGRLSWDRWGWLYQICSQETVQGFGLLSPYSVLVLHVLVLSTAMVNLPSDKPFWKSFNSCTPWCAWKLITIGSKACSVKFWSDSAWRRNLSMGLGEMMAQQFRALLLFQRTLVQFLAPMSGGSQLIISPASGTLTFSSGLCRRLMSTYLHACARIFKNKKKY